MNSHSGTTKNLALISRVLTELRKIDPEMPIQVASVFLEVALSENPISMSDLGTRAGIAQSSVSRNVATLGKVNRFHQPGHDLLEAHEDPVERRRKLVTLTAKGRMVAQSISEIVERTR